MEKLTKKLRRILCRLFGHIQDDAENTFCICCGEKT